MTQLTNTPPPRLPTAPTQYEPRFHDQHSDVLRLYFNQLSGTVGALTGPRGGKWLQFPYGAFQNNANISLAAINTPALVPMASADYASGMYHIVGDGIHVEQSGIYNYQFSIQFENANTQIHDAHVWLRKNGANVPWTDSAFSIISSHGGVPGYLIGAANFYIDLTAGDYIELWWAADSTLVTMRSLPAITSPYARPGSPAVVATLSFVSNVPT